MKIQKISVFIHSTDVVFDYKSEKKKELLDDFSEKLSVMTQSNCIVGSGCGRFKYVFYVITDVDNEACKTRVSEILKDLLSAEKFGSGVIVAVTNPDDEEIQKIKENDLASSKNQDFWSVASNVAGIKVDETKTAVPQEEKTAVAETIKDESEENVPAENAATENVAVSDNSGADVPAGLVAKAKKLDEMKNGLLSRVKGQRHAVEELVQSVFECELFAANNPERKGPLATFLFTGPSGVGKTFLANECKKYLNIPIKVIDMSEFSDNLANMKFNGDHGQPAMVTGFVRENPKCILVFDEIEKAHINTIHLFLQILDAGTLTDLQLRKDVSFRDTIIIMTTNAGKSLYEDPTVCDLSNVPRNVILDALRTDINPQTREPFFPECITTRMANGHVILFNHLEPYALMEIVKNEVKVQLSLFEQSTGIHVEYDPQMFAAMVMYNGGGVSDARTLRGLARTIIVKELQEIVMQYYAKYGDKVNELKNVTLSVDINDSQDIGGLFTSSDKLKVVAFAEKFGSMMEESVKGQKADLNITADCDAFKKMCRGVVDYILIDPLCGYVEKERTPNDVEDITSTGMQMFEYVKEFCPEVPVYILDTSENRVKNFDTLLARGARGVLKINPGSDASFGEELALLSFTALINNGVYSLGRRGKVLSFNCAQYIIDNETAVISFEKLKLRSAHRAGDKGMIVSQGTNNDVRFKDVIGCKKAKEVLSEFCKALDNPRETLMKGKNMPKGVLLYGPPGTGKTLLAKAMANECKATFIQTSATSLFGSLVGESERNVRELFARARRYAPSIIFIDEVDAIARMRSGSSSTAHNEDTLNAFLAEMDGFVSDVRRPVFILAATNYDIEGDSGRVLDRAFVRRFNERILVELPDTDDRYDLLMMSLKKHGIHFGENHEEIVKNMAERTGGMNNADLEMMNSQFARTLGDNTEPDGGKYMDALDEYRFGVINKMDPDHLRQTACHEAGHALVCKLCGTTPSFLTIVSRGNYGGFMESAPPKNGTYTFDELMNLVCRCLAGRAAELEFYGNSLGTNTGASSDIEKARYYIRACLKDFGMGENLFGHWTVKEAESLIQKQFDRTKDMINQHRVTLEKLTDLLMEKKSLDRCQLEEFFSSENI